MGSPRRRRTPLTGEPDEGVATYTYGGCLRGCIAESIAHRFKRLPAVECVAAATMVKNSAKPQ